VTIDAPNFCCQEYIATMAQLIERNWTEKQTVSGVTRMMFTIRRDGRIENIKLERSSGFDVLDIEAARALRLTQLPPLPDRYLNPTLTIHLDFDYLR